MWPLLKLLSESCSNWGHTNWWECGVFPQSLRSCLLHSGEISTFPELFYLEKKKEKKRQRHELNWVRLLCKYLCMVAWKSCIMHHKKANTQRLNSRRLCRSLSHVTGPLMKTLSVKITRDEWIPAHVRGCRWVRRHRSKWHREQKSGREVEEPDSPRFPTVRNAALNDMNKSPSYNKTLCSEGASVTERVLSLSPARMEPEVQWYGFPVKSHSWCGLTCQGQEDTCMSLWENTWICMFSRLNRSLLNP